VSVKIGGSVAITIERQGRRSYIIGDTYPHRDALRGSGAHWDAAKRAWWTGSQAKAEEIVAGLAAAPAATLKDETLSEDAREIIGRGTYRGSSVYVLGRVVERGRTAYDRDEIAAVKTRDSSRVKVCSRDGSRVWWASTDEVSVDKRYERLQSIRGLREYAAQAKQALATYGYVPVRGRDYCGYPCRMTRRRCTADDPCYDCQ
jgi:hypothetical protein